MQVLTHSGGRSCSSVAPLSQEASIEGGLNAFHNDVIVSLYVDLLTTQVCSSITSLYYFSGCCDKAPNKLRKGGLILALCLRGSVPGGWEGTAAEMVGWWVILYEYSESK